MEIPHRPRSRARGLALITALFLTLVIFSLVTVTVARTRHDLRFTGLGARRTQAEGVSRAAVGMGLHLLSSKPGFVADHLVLSDREIPQKAWKKRDGETSMQIWFRTSPAAPEVYYLFARGEADGVVHDALATLRIHRSQPGVSYAQATDTGDKDRMYALKAGSGEWDDLENPPRISFDKDGNRNSEDGTVDKPWAFTADGFGGLFTVWRRDGLDTLFHYDRRLRHWIAVRPPPRRIYDPEGSLREGTADNLTGHLDELACDGQSRLYTRTAHEGIDTIQCLRLDLTRHLDVVSRKSWQVLPPAPDVRHELDSSGRYVTLSKPGFATNLQGLTADRSGNLFASCRRQGTDTVYRWDASEEKWDALPPPPRLLLDRDSSGAVVPVMAGSRDDLDLTSMAADPDGNVYAKVRVGKVVALLKWTGARARSGTRDYTGSWAVLTPPDQTFFRELRDRLDLPSGAATACDRLGDEDPDLPPGAIVERGYDAEDGITNPPATRHLAVDAGGRLTWSFSKAGRSVPCQYVEGTWSLLPPPMRLPQMMITLWPPPDVQVSEEGSLQVTAGGLDGPQEASYEIRSISF